MRPPSMRGGECFEWSKNQISMMITFCDITLTPSLRKRAFLVIFEIHIYAALIVLFALSRAARYLQIYLARAAVLN